MAYSRANPSPHYQSLVLQYQDMHQERYFTGIGCYKFHKQLRRLIQETGSQTLLDYGCGKGTQFSRTHNPKALYAKLKIFCTSWQEALGIEQLSGYDPGVADFATLPLDTYDGVMAIDVLEHIHADDLPWILDEIFSYAKKFVFLTVATSPAKKNLPNGDNAHVTLQSPEWWMELLENAYRKNPTIVYEVVFENGQPS